MRNLQHAIVGHALLNPVSVTSDGAAGAYVDYNGFNRALVVVQGGLVATGDSDDTITLTVSKVDDIAAASAATSDEVAITASAVTLGPPATTDANLGIKFIDLDFMAHGLDGGCLTIDALASEGGAAVCSAAIFLYNKTGETSDTAMTITAPASS